jgi:hypothetical protein
MVQKVSTREIATQSVDLPRLARAGTAGQVLTSQGAGADPAYADIPPPSLVAPRGYIDGFVVSNDTTDAVNDIRVSAGLARDDGDAANLSTTATILKQLDVVFAEYSAPGTASGGRASADNLTGAKWFHVFLIGGSGKNTQPFFATSLTPTLPSGFTVKRRVGSIYWTGTAIRAFLQMGDEFLWMQPIYDGNPVGVFTTGALVSLSVPSGIKVWALFNAGAYEASRSLTFTSPDLTAIASATAGFPKSANTQFSISNETGSTIALVPMPPTRTDTAGRVYARVSNATNAIILTRGWKDQRGKDQ